MRTNELSAKPTIILPTIRDADFVSRFFYHWQYDFTGCHVIVVEDRPKKILENLLVVVSEKYQFSYDLYDWNDIDKDLGTNGWIIPRHSDAIRSYGFLKAWQKGALFCVTLDDDVRPFEKGHHIREFGRILLNGVNSNDACFFSTLKDVAPRGTSFVKQRPLLVHGMWLKNPDYGAKTQLDRHESYTDSAYESNISYAKQQFNEGIVPRGAMFSMCSMNVAWNTDIAKWMYFGLQGNYFPRVVKTAQRTEERLVRLPLDRYGDIWTGFFAKKHIDNIGATAYTGAPYVVHERASNIWTSIEREKNGLTITRIMAKYHLDYSSIVEQFPEYQEYFATLKEAMAIWESYFVEGEENGSG